MGCLVALFARLAVVVMWISTPLVSRAFHGGWVLPVLGLLLLPITTLVYTIVFTLAGDVTGWAWLWVILAFLLDLGAHGSAAHANRHRFARKQASEV